MRAAVEATVRKTAGKPSGEIAQGDLNAVEDLDLHGLKIPDVSALVNLPNLISLNLSDNLVEDVQPLGSLKELGCLAGWEPR